MELSHVPRVQVTFSFVFPSMRTFLESIHQMDYPNLLSELCLATHHRFETHDRRLVVLARHPSEFWSHSQVH